MRSPYVSLRLQRKGCRNNPFWHIVAAPKYENIRGKILEHLGYWVPRAYKYEKERQIVINKERVQFWLASGAQPSWRVQLFLSYFDIMPPPVIEFGRGTVYQKPREVKDDDVQFKELNPYRVHFQLERFMHKILQQEQNSYFARQSLLQNEMYRRIFFNSDSKQMQLEFTDNQEELAAQIDKLRADLEKFTKNQSQPTDSQQTELLVERINYLFRIWRQNNEKEEFQKFLLSKKDHQYRGVTLSDRTLRSKLEFEALSEHTKVMEQKQEQLFFMQEPISQEEFKEYLIQNGRFSEVKADLVTRQSFRRAKDIGFPVTRGDAYQQCQNQNNVYITNGYQFSDTSKYPDDNVYIPVTKPVMPFPNIDKYDPTDYYEIPRMFDVIKEQNRPYSLPNISDNLMPKEINDHFFRGKSNLGRSTGYSYSPETTRQFQYNLSGNTPTNKQFKQKQQQEEQLQKSKKNQQKY